MKKFNYFITGCLSLFLATTITAQTTVLGYFPSYRATSVVTSQYSKLTDIVFAFINPKTNGTLELGNVADATFGFDNNKFVTIKAGASANNVKLWIALGGADASELRSARLNTVCDNNSYRASLVSDLVSFAITHGLEGIDIDWEFPKSAQARTGHLNLIKDLRVAINNSSNTNLKISIAMGGEYKFTVNHLQYLDAGVISDASLVDKFNIMAYDFPSSYNANHSSYADAQGSMENWNSVMSVPYSKMLLGIPFYGRSSWAGEKEYNNMTGGTAASRYTSDYDGTYYYNGKATIESKIDLVSTKGAKGILIWDLGQDRSDQYSLLTVIDDKMQIVCTVPKANLGADRGVCSGASTVLDPGVPAATGRTFAWTKDGVSTGGNTTTLNVNAAGTYKVVISATGCSREDEIIIVTGSSVTTTGAAGCDNESLTVSVNSPDGAKTYKWFDAASAGTQLGTGTSYSATFAANATVYVEEAAAGVNSYTTSPSTVPEGIYFAWSGASWNYRTAQRIEVQKDLTIKSLRALTSLKNGCTFSVRVRNSGNMTDFITVGPFTKAGDGVAASDKQDYFDFDVNIALTTGNYFLEIVPNAGDEANYAFINDPLTGHVEAGVFNLNAGMYQASSTIDYSEATTPANVYGPFINWIIETGANASCGRTATSITVAACGPPVVSITAPTASQDFPFSSPATTGAAALSATATDEGTLASVTFKIYNGATLVETVATNNSGGTYTGTYNGPLGSYTLQVEATDNDGNVTTETVAFTISDVTSVSVLSAKDVQLYPSPSNDVFQIKVGGASSFVLSVYSAAGQLISTQNVSGNTASFGAELNAGSYVVKVVSGEGTYQTQVVKN